MTSISAAVHHVRVRRIREKVFDQIDCFGDDDSDLFEVLSEELAGLRQRAARDEVAQEVLEVSELRTDGREIYGIIDSGAYGIESVLRDIRNNRIAYHKRPHHADMMPFYFHFDLPQGRDTGLLVLQRTGIFGIQHALSNSLSSAFRRRFPSHVLSFNLVLTKDVIEQYVGEESELTELHFIKHELSPDIADSIRRRPPLEGSMDLALKFRSAGFPLRQQILRVLRGQSPAQALFELVNVNFAVDDVKIKTKTAGKSRTLNLGDPRKALRADIDITENVTLSGGHPTLESIHAVASDIIHETWAKLYGA